MQTLLVGAGTMGQSPSLGNLSYAAALNLHPATHLCAIVDPDKKRQEQLQAHSNALCFTDLNTALDHRHYDLVIVASTDQLHYEQLLRIAAAKPQAVIVEKPITLTPKHTDTIIALYQQAGILLVPNYTRRFLPYYQQLKDNIINQGHISTTIYYAKGLKHNGCHAIDLIRWFFGEIINFKILKTQNDHSHDDPSISLYFECEQADNIFLTALDERCYTHFEINIFTESHRYIIKNDHQQLLCYQQQENTGTPKGKRLILKQETKLAHHEATVNLLEYVHLRCQVQQTVDNLIKSAAKSELLTYQICKKAQEYACTV